PSGRMGGCPGGPRGRGVAPGRGLLPVAASLPPGLPEGPRGLPASLPRVCRLPPGAVRTVPVRAEGRRRQRFPGVLRALLRPRGRGGPPGQVAERLPHGPERPRRGAVSLAPAALPPLGAAPDRGLPGEVGGVPRGGKRRGGGAHDVPTFRGRTEPPIVTRRLVNCPFSAFERAPWPLFSRLAPAGFGPEV
ncbi:unnamed protein product, partial [Prorocentrum cordatum]